MPKNKTEWTRAIVLWAGIYFITVMLFWIESGHLATGLKMGLISASLKTAWASLHHRLYHQQSDIEDTVRI